MQSSRPFRPSVRNICLGSLADTRARIGNVRFALKSGHAVSWASMSAKCHERTKLRFRSCFAWHRNHLRRRTSLWVRSAFRRRAIIKDSQQQGARLGGCIGAANRDLDDFPACVACPLFATKMSVSRPVRPIGPVTIPWCLSTFIVPSTNNGIILWSRMRGAPISGVNAGMPASINAFARRPG
jgi:hypothetical protein